LNRRIFVDANVFLRFFTRDDESQQKRSEGLFRSAAAGEAALITGPPVLFEVAWTLRSVYDLPKGCAKFY
jgi:predicted nucleic acid-binding protein